jgi:hypothetical protein
MKNLIVTFAVALFSVNHAIGQIKPKLVKKSIQPAKTTTMEENTPPPVYSISSAKLSITTGYDNKESPSMFTFFISEKLGISGAGRELFTQKDQSGTAELKINSTTEIPLQKFNSTQADAFNLSNIENKGIHFMIIYTPNIVFDAWKINAVTITLEFKDQYGRLHPVSPIRTIQFNTPNGLLTHSKFKMTGTTDGFLTPQPVLVTDK